MSERNKVRRSTVQRALACLAMVVLAGGLLPVSAKDKPKVEPAKPELPKRDLTVELRQVDDGPSSGYTVGTQPQTAPFPAQAVRVRNGEKASLRMGQSMPVQWVQAVSAQNVGATAPGVNLRSSGGSVSQGMTWMNAGQSIDVTPRWSGKGDVALEVEVQTSALGDQAASGLPLQNQSQLATTVTAPMGIWVIIASSGGAVAQKGSYGSETGTEVRRTLQVRVTVP